MEQPILKSHWERFKAHVDLDILTAEKLLAPFTKNAIEQLILLSEGCANTNYKVIFKNGKPPIVIRIYVREKEALQLELDIYKLVADKIPVPVFLFADDTCSSLLYPYAIFEWIDGKLMREVILAKNEGAIRACAYEAGKYLNVLRKIKLPMGGFFKKDLQIRAFSPDEEYLPYVSMLLKDDVVRESLGDDLHKAVSYLVMQYSHLLSAGDEANLTHADYDPANIMVHEINGQWKIVAILDWEFAYAGTYLLDIGLMLRYSHRITDYYEKSFIDGLQEQGDLLPANWKKRAKLMDLLCLLQMTHYNPLSERPNTNRDAVSLLADIVINWDSYE